MFGIGASLRTRAIVALLVASLAIFVAAVWRPGAQPRPTLEPVANVHAWTYPQTLPMPMPLALPATRRRR